MEKREILEMARAAGLEKAAREFPDDVIIAAEAAMKARTGFQPPDINTAEPWPPMRTKVTP